MRPQRKEIGLAVIGCGTIGRIRAEFARDYPGIGWLGLCDSNAEVGQKLAEDAKADSFTTDYNELLKRPEVTAAIIATDENAHVGGLIQFVRVSGPAAADLVSARGARPHARGSAKSRLEGLTRQSRLGGAILGLLRVTGSLMVTNIDIDVGRLQCGDGRSQMR